MNNVQALMSAPFRVLIHDAEPFIYTDTELKAVVEKDVLHVGKIVGTRSGNLMEAVSIFAAGTWSIHKIESANA